MCFSFFWTLTWDMIFSEEIFKELIFWLYGHWEDPCDQPIGHLQQCFWIVFWIKVTEMRKNSFSGIHRRILLLSFYFRGLKQPLSKDKIFSGSTDVAYK